jgi:hypothetical protein
MASEKTKASEDQIIYANILNWGMVVGFLILTAAFLMYVFGVLPNFVPIEDLPLHWTKKVHDFNHDLHAPTGWGWLAYIGKGDYLNFIGVAILAGLTIVCYLAIIPSLLRKKDTPYLVIAIAEVLVLVLAASGILKGGGH